MARESKTEVAVRESITNHLAANERLREFTWGKTENSISAAYLLFGALAGQNQLGYFVGLTDKRLILIEVKGKTPTGEVYNIAMSDIKGLQYHRGSTNGKLNVHLSADILQLIFDKRPWWPRAKNMAQIMPLQR